MSGLCKRLMLSSLIISLISLSCGPDAPTPQLGPVDVKATGTYRMHNPDGTLAFEREIDSLCEVRGAILPLDPEYDYPSGLHIRLFCFENQNEKNNFPNLYYRVYSAREYLKSPPYPGTFYIVYSDFPYDDVKTSESWVSGMGYYDPKNINEQGLERFTYPIKYYFDHHHCSRDLHICKFSVRMFSGSNSDIGPISAEMDIVLSGIKYE